ncbi:MAG: hypothetical protein IPI07_18700 [Flavobacteriales bacterium]|nr:hypothetical protein [Flavobacteriales bacterium]
MGWQVRVTPGRKCASPDWATITPAIFGALFQSGTRSCGGKLGAYYTSEQNIRALIGRLSSDRTWDELEKVWGDKNKLEQVPAVDKLGGPAFPRPSVRCGNFPAITYHELRA